MVSYDGRFRRNPFEAAVSQQSTPPRITASVPEGFRHIGFLVLGNDVYESHSQPVAVPAEHPVRRDLQSGALRSFLFNCTTGIERPIDRREWYGSRLWDSIPQGVLREGPDFFWLLTPSGDVESPGRRLLNFIDNRYPEFPPRLRRAIELYFELGIAEFVHREGDVLEKLKSQRWSLRAPSKDRIEPVWAKNLAFLWLPREYATGDRRVPRGPSKNTSGPRELTKS